MFVNHRNEDKIYPLRKKNTLWLKEIAKAQYKDQELKIYHKNMQKHPKEDFHLQLIENIMVLYKDEN